MRERLGRLLRAWAASPRCAVVGGVLVGLISLAWFVPVWLGQRNDPPSWTLGELDTTAIHQGILEAPRLVDTLRWWTGPWVWGIPFYRPLTSMLFWGEYQLFGEREWLFALPTMAAYLLSCALFALLTHRLAQRSGLLWPALVALLAAAGFAGLFAGYRASITALIYQYWKNQPDTMAATCLFAALLSYLGSKDRARPPVGATLWYLAACGFKEMAVPLPLLALFLEPGLRKKEERAAAIRRLLWLFAAAALFLLVRHAAIGGLGYTYGRNQMWAFRTVQELVGPFLHTLTGNWEYNALGVLAFGWMVARGSAQGAGARSFRIIAGIVAALAVAGTAVAIGLRDPAGADSPLDPTVAATGLTHLAHPNVLLANGASLLFLLAWRQLWRVCRTGFWFCAAWVTVFLLPLVFSPGAIHRYFIPQAGYWLAYALAAGTVWSQWAGRHAERAEDSGAGFPRTFQIV